MSYITTSFFDIGTKNLAWYVERHSISTLHNITSKYLVKKIDAKRNRDDILNELYSAGEVVQLKLTSITTDKGTELNNTVLHTLFDMLEGNREVWNQVDAVVIEQQFSGSIRSKPGGGFCKVNTGANVVAIKIAQTIYTWFLLKYPDTSVEYYNGAFKTNTLGAPSGINKAQRKKWSTDKAIEILNIKGDNDAIEYMKSLRKKDDVADCITMGNAYVYNRYINKFCDQYIQLINSNVNSEQCESGASSESCHA